MDNLRNKLKKINITGRIAFNEPMKLHTTFKTGGPADIFCSPADSSDILNIVKFAVDNSVPYFIIGGGANILVSDSGLRGIVIETGSLNRAEFKDDGRALFGSGLSVDTAADKALENSLEGFDSFYGMPGTIGGAVWMNARCYGVSISDILLSVKYFNDRHELCTLETDEMYFEYKKSPFQNMDCIILEAEFQLKSGNRNEIRERMQNNRLDREKKGHFSGPSAGSVFKNNRQFGKPSGAIIDSLGLRGYKIGGAKVSDQHANIFINTGDAKSSDIYELIAECSRRVKDTYGFELEPEVQFLGNF